MLISVNKTGCHPPHAVNGAYNSSNCCVRKSVADGIMERDAEKIIIYGDGVMLLWW